MSTLMRAHILAIVALLLVPVRASAADVPLTVSEAWFRALPSGLPAGGYFTLHNNGPAAVSLTGAESSACGMLMLHKSENGGGMSSMTDVSSVDVAAGKSVSFAPGGYHLMCMQPAAAMKPGSTVKVTFTFAGGAKVGCRVRRAKRGGEIAGSPLARRAGRSRLFLGFHCCDRMVAAGRVVATLARIDRQREFLFGRVGAIRIGRRGHGLRLFHQLTAVVDARRGIFQRIDRTRAAAGIVRRLAVLRIGRHSGRLRENGESQESMRQ